MNLNWLYTAISFIMLRWHDVFSFLEDRTFLSTDWDWILAIIFLVLTVRVILFPLFVKQIKSQRAMQALQPQLKELQQKHKGDRETLQKEMMELYRREKANPLMGCLPLLLQIPVFISLFWILGRRLDPNRAWRLNWPEEVPAPDVLANSKIELYGWTLDQYGSAAEAKLFNAPIAALFYEVGWFERDMASHYEQMGTTQLNVMLVAGTLAIIMVLTTFLTSRQMVLKTGWSTEPTQLMMQRLMVYGLPAMLLFSGAFFPISVIIYWVTNNLFSLGQQQWVLRKYPPPPSAAKTAPTTGGRSGGGKAPAGKGEAAAKSTGKGKGKGKADAPADEVPAVDGRQLAPKPGAKPHQKRVPPKKAAGGPQNVPPRKAAGGGAKSVPPKKAAGGPRNVPPKPAAGSGGQSVPPRRKGAAPDSPAAGAVSDQVPEKPSAAASGGAADRVPGGTADQVPASGDRRSSRRRRGPD